MHGTGMLALLPLPDWAMSMPMESMLWQLWRLNLCLLLAAGREAGRL